MDSFTPGGETIDQLLGSDGSVTLVDPTTQQLDRRLLIRIEARSHPPAFAKAVAGRFGERQRRSSDPGMWKLRRHAQDPIKVPEEDKHFLIHFDGPLSPWELLGRLRVLKREVPKLLLRSFRGGRFLPARRTHSVLPPLRIRTLAGHPQCFAAHSSFKGVRRLRPGNLKKCYSPQSRGGG